MFASYGKKKIWRVLILYCIGFASTATNKVAHGDP
jgi:hypothetical protein